MAKPDDETVLSTCYQAGGPMIQGFLLEFLIRRHLWTLPFLSLFSSVADGFLLMANLIVPAW